MNYGKDFYKAYNGQFAGDTLSPEIIRLARPYIKGRVLDVGAGSGAMMKHIRTLNHVHALQQEPIDEINGIDIQPANSDIIEAGIDNIPFSENYFDTIICSEVLEHLDSETLIKGIQEIYGVLKLGGHIIITSPYNEDLNKNTVKCPSCNCEFHRWGHYRTIDRGTILDIFENRFKTIKCDIVPLGFMATHKTLRYFTPIIKDFPFVRYETKSLFVVAQKI